MATALLYARSLIFYCGWLLVILFFTGVGALFSFVMSPKARHDFISLPAPFITVMLRVICGIQLEVKGWENIPQETYVALAKHQSDWETYYLHRLLRPVSTILKKELLRIPIFGWGLAKVHPIAIDRTNPREAMRQIMAQGQERLRQGNNILIFPEGTRIEVGERGKYARSGAALAIRAGVPVVAIAHNAGRCWPNKTILKYPGTIRLEIGEPIPTTNENSRAVTDRVEAWIEAKQQEFAELDREEIQRLEA